MRQSESIKELATALCAAQKEMGGAVKDAANPFFNSKYADLTSVVKAIKEPFANHGLSYTQFPCAGERSVGVITRLMHSSGEWLEHEYMLPMVKADPQSAGSAITYARRYALQSMAGIPTADDDAESAMLRGSDLPNVTFTDEQNNWFNAAIDAGDALALYEVRRKVGDDLYSAMNASFPAKKKMDRKGKVRDLEAQAGELLQEMIDEINTALTNGDPYAVQVMQGAAKAGRHVKSHVWESLTPEQQAELTAMKEQAA